MQKPINQLIAEARPATQGKYIYRVESDERWRYNPRRRANRAFVEELYADGRHTPFPVHLIVETTNVCNLDCVFCNRIVMSRPVQTMKYEVFQKIVDEAVANNVYSMSLYMLGEPMMNKRIREFVNYAKKMGIPYVDISTNGHYDLKPLLGTALDELIISIDGNTKETFEALREKSNWETVIKNVDEFLDAKAAGRYEYPFVRMQIIDLQQTHGEINGFIERWLPKADVIYLKKFEEMRQSFDEEHSKGLRLVEEKEEPRIPCKQLFFTLNVNSNGDITLCCHDPHGYLVVGNIEKETSGTIRADNGDTGSDVVYQIPQMSLAQAWESAKANFFRVSHKAGKYPSICAPCKDWKW